MREGRWTWRVLVVSAVVLIGVGCSSGECSDDSDCPGEQRCSLSGGVVFGASICVAGSGSAVVNNEDPPSDDVGSDVFGGGFEAEVEFTHTPPEVTAVADANFQFVCAAAGCVTECSLNDGVSLPCAGAYAADGLDDGAHRLEVTPRHESSGEVGEVAEFQWQVDSSPPGIEVLQAPEALHYVEIVMVELQCTKEPCELSCEVSDHGPVACGGGPVEISLDPGEYELVVDAVDDAGQEATEVVAWSITTQGTVVVAAFDGTARKFDPQGEVLWSYEMELPEDAPEGMTNWKMGAAVNPEGEVFLSAHNAHRVFKLDWMGREIWTVDLEEELAEWRTRGIAVGQDGEVFVAGNIDGVVALEPDGQVRWHDQGHTDQVYNVTVDSAGYVFTASRDQTVRKLDPATGEQMEVYSFDATVRAIAADPDGAIFAGGDGDFALSKLDASGEVVERFEGHEQSIYEIALHPEGHLFTASRDETVRRVDESLEEVWSFDGFTDRPHTVVTTPEGEVFTGTRDGVLYKLSEQGDEVWRFDGFGDAIHTVAADPGLFDTFWSQWLERLGDQ